MRTMTKGNENPASIELRETYLVRKTVRKKIPAQTAVATGLMARTTPTRVATPFPPLN